MPCPSFFYVTNKQNLKLLSLFLAFQQLSQCLNIGKGFPQIIRHVFGSLIGSHAYRFRIILYHIIHEGLVHILAEDKTDGRILMRLPLKPVQYAQNPAAVPDRMS